LTDETRKASSSNPSPGSNGDEEDTMFGLPRKAVAEPFAILLGSQFILFVGVGALLPALPLYAQSIGLSGSANGVVLSAPALAMLLLNLPAGKLVDSWGRKQMMMAGMFVIALADFATGQCRTIMALVPARLSLGAGRSAAEGGDRAYLADLTDRCPSARGTITGTQQAVQALGLVIGPLIGGKTAEAYGAPSVFYLISFAALACTAGYSLLPEINGAQEKEEQILAMSMDMSEEEEEEFQRTLEIQKKKADWGTLLKSNRQRVLVIAASANALGFVAKLTCIPWFASATLGASPAEVGELFSLTALLGMASAPLGGVLADKIGLKAVIVVSLAFCAAGLGFAKNAEDVHALQICIGVWGMGTAAAGPAVNALAIESAPKGGEGEALTLPKTAGDFVFLVGPIILGLSDDFLGSPGSSLGLVSGAAAVAAVGAAVFLKGGGLSEEDEGGSEAFE
jgi:MFS family permease